MTKDGFRTKYLHVKVPTAGKVRREALNRIYDAERSLTVDWSRFFFVCETLSVKICPIPVKPCLSLSGRARDREKKAAQSARLLLPASGEIVADNCPDSPRSSHSSDPLPLGDAPSTWDPYGWDDLFDVSKKVPPPIERTDAVVQTRVETNDAAVQTEPWPPGANEKDVCAMCLFAAMQKTRESPNVMVEKALTASCKKDITRMRTKSWKLSRTRRTQWVACLMGMFHFEIYLRTSHHHHAALDELQKNF